MKDKNYISNLPIPSAGGISLYLAQIKKFPMLDAEEEYMLAKNWKEHGNLQSAHKLVTSHLRLVAKIAMGYRGYGLRVNELISEGNLGLMQAVKRFEPDRGFRLATYAMWSIRASIHEYILHSWSLVKVGTTAAQKKLFFNLRKIKGQLKAIDDGDISPEQDEHIAQALNVSEDDVVSMNRRMLGPDQSLNTPVNEDGGGEWQDWLESNQENQESVALETDEFLHRRSLLLDALPQLNERERHIIQERRLKEEPSTLEALSEVYGISRERVRQIEVRAFEKLQKHMLNSARSKNLLPAN